MPEIINWPSCHYNFFMHSPEQVYKILTLPQGLDLKDIMTQENWEWWGF